jgi:hypothetical protein
MPLPDDQPSLQIASDRTRELSPRRRQLLWADLNGHIAASHLAESLGETKLVSKHLQAVTRLLVEIHS